ncbi:GTP-binding protein [Tsukamurella sp. 8F]|uniref:ribosome hibernation factor-recruiting GTPase MRF n=1 Tax=unclassified Tsukamurella TaxID=2633480 RepID=UPI0023BA2C3A|nr:MULTISPECIES: GTP-binding protein [unclassified Tsukamurella]MDF0532512.1 GTP-binding protein [Tsukamurella sp. 8J]MDF0589398.1 GTP-binding protein [Tsukamurella sp. 8F]
METVTKKTPVVLLTGWDTARADELAAPGTVVVHHDLSGLAEGLVVRTETTLSAGQAGDMPQRQALDTRIAVLELAHGCVSCTLRKDLLPLLRALHRRPGVERIVLRLDPVLEAEAIAHAVEHVVVSMAGETGAAASRSDIPDGPAGLDVEIAAVVGFVGEGWLDDALGDADLADRFATTEDDERTVAQLAVGHVQWADAVVVSDSPDPARLRAVVRRLAPGVPICRESVPLPRVLERAVGSARVGGAGPWAPLLAGAPPLEPDGDVALLDFAATRPFHPGRLHEAVDTLLDGVVTARGRVWLATSPDAMLWLESAGQGLRVGVAGSWDDCPDPLVWDEGRGNRHTSLVVLTAGADPGVVRRVLAWALVTDGELEHPGEWARWEDPFGGFHVDPCTEPALGTRESVDERTAE